MDGVNRMQNTRAEQLHQKIAAHLAAPYGFGGIHGSAEACFENLAFFIGCSREAINDDAAATLYELYAQRLADEDEVTGSDFVRSMVLNSLLFMGKKLGRADARVEEAFLQRLERVYAFAISGERIFYTAEERRAFKGIPPVWREQPIVRIEHTNPYLRLPYVYDLLGYFAMYGKSREADAKIDAVVDYILGDGYQRETLHTYGIGVNREKGFVKSAYYAVGWDVCVAHLTPRQELLYLWLLSPVAAAVRSPWYQTTKAKLLNAAQGEDGALLKQICATVRKTYWTSGCYLDLGKSANEKSVAVSELIHSL